jgi:putative monooxygenase ydhR
MYASIVNFHLEGQSEEEYRAVCDQFAPEFAEVPGLICKVWLADAVSNTYGGVYLWRDRTACEEFERSELFAAVGSDPHFGGISVRDFAVLEDPTRITRGLVAVGA